MIDTSKVAEFFDASKLIHAPLHVIGCGAVGGYVAMSLVQMGCDNIHLWDFDIVEPKNLTNQVYRWKDVGKEKVEALAEMMRDKNPDLKLTLHKEGIKPPYIANGYLFLCVDNMDLRREIVKANEYNQFCEAFFDFRMRLTDGQLYYAARDDEEQVKYLLSKMNFSHEEASEATRKSACNIELSVVYTVMNLVSLGMSNFQKYCVDRSLASESIMSNLETNFVFAGRV